MSEQRAIYVGLVLGGLLPVAGWLARGGAASAGITLCLGMIVAGLVGLVTGWRRGRHPLPKATLRP